MDLSKAAATQGVFTRLMAAMPSMTSEQIVIMRELSDSILATGMSEIEWRRRALTAELPLTFWQRLFGVPK